MYEACSPFLNGCSHIPLKRKQVLGLKTEKVRHFFGSFFRKRRKKNTYWSYGNYFMFLRVLEATTHVTISGFSQTYPSTGWKQGDRKLNACTDELRRIPASTALVFCIFFSIWLSTRRICECGSGKIQLLCILDSRNSPNIRSEENKTWFELGMGLQVPAEDRSFWAFVFLLVQCRFCIISSLTVPTDQMMLSLKVSFRALLCHPRANSWFICWKYEPPGCSVRTQVIYFM